MSSPSATWALLAAALLLLCGSPVYADETHKDVESTALFAEPPFQLNSSMEIEHWDYDMAFAIDFAFERQPRWLENTMASAMWPVFTKPWTWLLLKRVMPRLNGVRVSKSPRFQLRARDFHLNKSLEIPGEVIDEIELRNMSLTEFLRTERARKEDDPYMMHVGMLSQTGLDKDCEPSAYFHYKDQLVKDSVPVGMLWMSHTGVTEQLHYDESHNFIVQVFGRRRFYLFPPSDASKLYFFPHNHPSYHQSMVDFSNADLVKFPDIADAVARVITLEPGDFLYIPPYWSYMAETHELSLSVSIVNPSTEELVWAEMLGTPIAYAKTFAVEERAVAAQMLLKMLLPKVNVSSADPRGYMKKLFAQRYEPTYEQQRTQFYLEQGFSCSRKRRHFRARIHREYREAMVEASDQLAELLHHPGILQEGNRDIMLSNYIEEIAKHAVGTANVALFLKRCF